MYPNAKSWRKDSHLCPKMERIELQDCQIEIGEMKNLKELRVGSIKMPPKEQRVGSVKQPPGVTSNISL
jgi:hypothetical protein